MLTGNAIVESTNAAGTGDILLLGARPGCRTFGTYIQAGAQTYYFMLDDNQREWGIGTLYLETPNRLTRDTVLGNTEGSTEKLNFAGAALVYSDIPTERLLMVNADDATVTGLGRRMTDFAPAQNPFDLVTKGVVDAQLAAEAAARAAALAPVAAAQGNTAAALSSESQTRAAETANLGTRLTAAEGSITTHGGQIALRPLYADFNFAFTSTNGSQRFPYQNGVTGLIMKWGFGSTTNGRETITFPEPFPHDVLFLQAGEGAAGGWGDPPVVTVFGTQPIDRTRFGLRCAQLASGSFIYAGSGVTYRWLALGW